MQPHVTPPRSRVLGEGIFAERRARSALARNFFGEGNFAENDNNNNNNATMSRTTVSSIDGTHPKSRVTDRDSNYERSCDERQVGDFNKSGGRKQFPLPGGQYSPGGKFQNGALS